LKVIIVGAGEVGFHVANRFTFEHKEVVVIDTDPQAIRRVSEQIDVQGIVGSGSSPVVLEEAGIHEAEILLAVTDSDETNLVTCLMANSIAPTVKKLARLRNADYDNYHDVFRRQPPHIDTIINPEIEVVKTIQRLMSVPDAEDVNEFADGRLKLIGIRLESENRLTGVRLMDLAQTTSGHRTLIAAILRNDELIIPSGKDRLMPDDLVYFISDAGNYQDTLKIFGKKSDPIRRVLIVGGGRLGLRLATRLDEQQIYTKIVEKDSQRCLELADQLNRVIVLNGDGSDQELLNEENIHDMDVVVTVTDDEETNILVSLLSKRMGARKTITRISKFSYFQIMSAIGIQQVVSPRLSAINTILQHIRRGKVLSAVSIKSEQAEAIEAEALETSDIVDKPISDIKFPKGALVIGILRGEDIIIPSGESIIRPGNRIIIFARREAIPAIEKILTVKLEYF
jgi:trk/ktr system potassium uptake protein